MSEAKEDLAEVQSNFKLLANPFGVVDDCDIVHVPASVYNNLKRNYNIQIQNEFCFCSTK